MSARPPFLRRPFLRHMAARLRFWQRDEGSTTVEFVILVPVFLSILLAGVEAGVLSARQTMMERGMEQTMRALRLGRLQPVSPETLRESICRDTVIIRNCEASLLVELRRLNPQNIVLPAGNAPCVNRAENTVPAVVLTPGVEHDLVLVRICLIVDPVFPTSGLGLGLPRDASGGFGLVTSSVYVNEPR
jgi:hypothetical protein